MKTNILLIDTASLNNKLAFYALTNSKIILQDDLIIPQQKCAEEILVLINQLINKNKIDYLAIVKGPGSWTALRIGITVVKVWSWFKKIPLISLNLFDIENPNFDDILLNKIIKRDFIDPILLDVYYEKEPNNGKN